MAFTSPQQQEWWQRFLQQRQAAYSQQIEALHAAQPWQQPGYSRMANPLLAPSAIPGFSEADPQAAMMGYFMPGAGTVSLGGGGEGVAQGGGMNPQLMQLLMGGSGGAL